MKATITTLFIAAMITGYNAQVLITTNPALGTTPHSSAVLDIKDDRHGILLPQVALTGSTDNSTIPSPVRGLLVQNTNTGQSNFWAAGKWNRNFAVSDGLAIIKQTENFNGNSTASTAVSIFPTTVPLFNLNDSTTGWTKLNAGTTVTITKATNTNYVITEGMVQVNNSLTTDQKFQFAIGIFVNGQLKLASKYYTTSTTYVCSWRKFNLAGIFNDLPVGTHNVEVYGRNLPIVTSGYTQIVYGGNSSNCDNINNDMARIYVTAQTSQ